MSGSWCAGTGFELKRIGVFGGAFDPPHAAHVALARVAVAELELDELHVVPTGQAWHKQRPLSPAKHRLAMARLAFVGVERVLVDTCEIERAGPSYSVQTLSELKAQHPQADLFMVLGEDQARALPSWKQWQEILRFAIICVAERVGSTGTVEEFVAPKGYESRFRRLPMPTMSVSATEIRARIAARQGLAPLVFDSVARYIDNHHLYQTA